MGCLVYVQLLRLLADPVNLKKKGISMRVSNKFYHRSMLTSAILLVLVALVLTTIVIPAVKAECLRGGTPEVAVYAFWVNVFFNLLAAILIWFVTIRINGRRFILVPIVFILLLLGWALADSGAAYLSHDPAMKTASIILFFCSGIDGIVVLLIIIVTAFHPTTKDRDIELLL